MSNYPKPSRPGSPFSQSLIREEGSRRFSTPTMGGGDVPKPSRPNPQKIAMAVAPILRGASIDKIRALDEIARLAGDKPSHWQKPKFGDFEYWLAHNCGWISDEELQDDADEDQAKRNRALQSSHRFSEQRYSWMVPPHHEPPEEKGDYAPAVDMKLIRDRNLTDSARRVAMFVLRHTYQDNRAGRFIGMTVTFIMKGLSLSRRTVQRSLTLLETQGYFRCEVAKAKATRMCIGLIIHLMDTLIPCHHKKGWPEKRRKSGASDLSNNQTHFYKKIYSVLKNDKVSRLLWACKCMNGVARRAFHVDPVFGVSQVPECRGFKTLSSGFVHPALRTRAMQAMGNGKKNCQTD